MVGITDSLRVAVSGLQLAQDSLATTSNNVANVNTEGYTKKRVEQEARVVAGRGVGVGEVAISRDVDQFLERQLRIQQGKLGKSQTVHAYAADVQGLVFGNPSEDATGLASAVDDLATKLEAAAAKPEDGARRSALIWAAQDTFDRLGGAADQVQVLRRDADQRIAALVAEVNTALQSIDDLNTDIVRSPEDAALLDQRDRLVKELSYKLDINTYVHEDNRIAIFTERGQPLLEYEPRVLDFAPASRMSRDAPMNPITIYPEDQIDPASGQPVSQADGEVMVGRGIRANAADSADDIRPTITGGELGGLLEVRDELLPDLDDQLQEFGTVLRHQLNEAHNGANPAGGYGPSLVGTQVRSDLDPAFDSMGGTVWFRVDDGATVNTVSIDLDSITVGASATEAIRAAIDGSPHLDASFDGDRLKLETSTGNGSIAIAHGVEDAGHEAQITTIEAGHERDYNFSHFFGLNNFVREPVGAADDPTALTLRDDIAADPQKIASAKLDVVPGPPPAATLGGVGDGRGLGDLAAALDRRMDTVGRGGLPNATVSAREYLGDVTSIQAMQAATAERTAKNDGILAEELDFQKAGVSGVNLDEEMAYLLELQQAYSTSARLITTADEMLQTLLNAKR